MYSGKLWNVTHLFRYRICYYSLELNTAVFSPHSKKENLLQKKKCINIASFVWDSSNFIGRMISQKSSQPCKCSTKWRPPIWILGRNFIWIGCTLEAKKGWVTQLTVYVWWWLTKIHDGMIFSFNSYSCSPWMKANYKEYQSWKK